MRDHPAPVDLGAVEGDGGVVWSAAPEGVHANLVVLGARQVIDAHRNNELDVLVVVLDGAATVTVDGVAHELPAAHALVVPRGAERTIASGDDGVRYLSIHRRRGGLGIA